MESAQTSEQNKNRAVPMNPLHNYASNSSKINGRKESFKMMTKSMVEDASEDFSNIEEHMSMHKNVLQESNKKEIDMATGLIE